MFDHDAFQVGKQCFDRILQPLFTTKLEHSGLVGSLATVDLFT